MDEITLLRALEADAPPPAPRALYRARMRLRHEIAYERRRARGPLLGPAIAVAASAVVMGAAVAVVDLDVPGPPPAEPPMQLTAAASALQLAAQAAGAEAADPIPRDDQYLYYREITQERPVDGRGRTRRFVDENWVPASGDGIGRYSELGRTWTTTAGSWPPTRYEELRRLPTDTGRLLLHARTLSGPPDTSRPMSKADYETAYMFLSFLLYKSAPMPPGLRAAALDALARIPGVEIVDDQVDLRGRRGVAISRPPLNGQAIVIDADTHEYLGFQNTDVREDGKRVERVSSRVETGVVDQIGERP